MLLINSEKFTIDGIDVYADHADPTQYWYVPGTIRLAERNKKKVLSYFWYTDSATDSDGTGFLNFEVDTAVSDATKDKIKAAVASRKNLAPARINLAAVTYTSGNVNFSVLGPIAKKAPADLGKKDSSVLYQSAEQLVWSAGSSSLVGDNAAVCSVKFTKEGKLAGAMKQAIEASSNSIAAVYGLRFLAMRPSVTFKVHGTLDKTVTNLAASIGGSIPLEALILDVGIQAQWQKIMQSTDLKIEVINFTGEQEEGEKWAKKFLLDYVLQNFFEVQIAEKFIPLADAPEVEKAVDTAKDVEETATEKEEEKVEKGEKTETETAGVVKEVVKAATAAVIPKVQVRVAVSRLEQTNTIDFLYNEMKAKAYSIAPQALVLEGLGQPKDYVMAVNRSAMPFGLPYPAQVVLPPDEDRKKVGLEALNVQAWYPDGQSRNRQQAHKLTMSAAGTVTGPNPFPFQYDDKGSTGVDYAIDYVFNPSEDWNADKSQYSYRGKSESGGLIAAMPAGALEFLNMDIRLASDFTWEDNNQVVVTLKSKRWVGEKTVVLRKGKLSSTSFRVRSGVETKEEPIYYRVSVRRNNREAYPLPEQKVEDPRIGIEIYDRFADHVPVSFRARFQTATSAQITMTYEDGDYVWEDEVTLEAEQTVKCVVPTVRKLEKRGDLKIACEVTPDEGPSFKLDASAVRTNVVNA